LDTLISEVRVCRFLSTQNPKKWVEIYAPSSLRDLVYKPYVRFPVRVS